MPTAEFYRKAARVSSAIGARRPEDLVLVLSAETNYTLDPASTKLFRPNVKPTNWANLKDICAAPGTGRCGALGLNTIEPDVARAIGMSASEWWRLPDMTPEENLDYVERYFLWVKAQVVPRLEGPYDDAFPSPLALYIANAAYGKLLQKLRPETVIYNAAETASNPGLDYNHDGVVTVQDIDDTIRYAVLPNSKKWLDEYAAAMAGTGTGAPPPGPSPYTIEPLGDELEEINARERRDFMEEHKLALGIAAGAIIITASSALAMIILHDKSDAGHGVFENPLRRAIDRCPTGSRVQSLLFSRLFFTTRGAQRWAKSHGYRYSKVDVTKKYVRLRQADPSHFARLRTVSFGRGVRAVIGWGKC